MRQLTPEEQREKLIDDRFYEFGRRISSFDPMIEDVRKAKESLQGFVTQLQAQESKEVSNYNELKASVASLEANDDLSDIRFKNLLERLDKLSEQHRQSKESLKSLESLCLLHLEKINALAEKSSALDRLESEFRVFRSEVNNSLRSGSDHLKVKETLIDQLQTDFMSLGAQLNSLKESQKQQEAFKNLVSGQLEDIKEVCDDRHQSTINFIESRCSEVKAEFAYKLSAIPLPKVDDFAHKIAVEKIASQIEVLYLDAKNALLKASNVEIQNQIQAKKIEHVLLTLKNQELNQG